MFIICKCKRQISSSTTANQTMNMELERELRNSFPNQAALNSYLNSVFLQAYSNFAIHCCCFKILLARSSVCSTFRLPASA